MATVKTTVGEWRRYLNAEWEHPDAWIDDEVATVDGVDVGTDGVAEHVPDAASMVVSGGTVYYPPDAGLEDIDLCKHFRRWIKAQNTAFVLVEVDKSQADDFRELVKSFGARVV